MNFNYSLGVDKYTFGNAMLWGNFFGHCQEASRGRQQGNMGKWAVHTLIAMAEFLPVVSQIASSIEAIIVRVLGASNQPKRVVQPPAPPPRSLTAPSLPTPAPVRAAKRKLVPLSGENHPKPLKLSTLTPTIFYPFNSEGIVDHGWGCAWRCIQTILSSYNIQMGFEEIFEKFGSRTALGPLYALKYGDEELPFEKPWVPHETELGWAEPFIGQMALQFCGIDSELETLNGFPACHTPKQVFHNAPLNFLEFQKRLTTHFAVADAPPVMIDNGTYALNIIGISVYPTNITLRIADPHIENSAASSAGLYSVDLDQEGKFLESRVVNKSLLFSNGSVLNALSFDGSRKWMILFPGTQIERPHLA
jgi:hypothetical protein